MRSAASVMQAGRQTATQAVRQTVPVPQASEGRLIGTAVPAELFLLIEAPLPWDKPALLSAGVPEAVRQVLKPRLGRYPGLRVHLIANESTGQTSTRRLLIFRRQLDQPQRYGSWDVKTTSPQQMAAAVAEQLAAAPAERLSPPDDLSAQKLGQKSERKSGQISRGVNPSDDRHLLICTHGSHNECCGVQGYPLYREAIALTTSLGLNKTQIWQVSHIGGHRYAPTLIDLPQGRYYGKLSPITLKLLLQQQGNAEDLAALMRCYRGWSLLPKSLQLQEQLRLAEVGWPWLQRGTWRSL